MNRGYIAVDGPPGAGVTAVATALTERLQCERIHDPAAANPFRADFAKSPQRFAFQMQTWCLMERFHQHRQLSQMDLFNGATTVVDYHFAKDDIFARASLSDTEYQLYAQIFRVLHQQTPPPNLFVLLTADLPVLRRRLRKLASADDRVIKMGLVEKVSAAWGQYSFNYEASALLCINTSGCDDLESPQTTDRLVDMILQNAGGKSYYQYDG